MGTINVTYVSLVVTLFFLFSRFFFRLSLSSLRSLLASLLYIYLLFDLSAVLHHLSLRSVVLHLLSALRSIRISLVLQRRFYSPSSYMLFDPSLVLPSSSFRRDEPHDLSAAGDNEVNITNMHAETTSSSLHHDDPHDISASGDNEDNEVDINGSLEGLTRKTLVELYELYGKHGRALGFGIRKSTTRVHNGVVVEKYFVCSSQGERKNNNPVEQNEGSSTRGKKKKNSSVTRTGCNAEIRVKLNDDGVYEVIHHIRSHNHPLTRKEWVHLHRSERVITNEKGLAIESMISSGMRASDSFRYMVEEAGGEQCVGHTMKDHLNFVNRLKMTAIEGGDAQSVIDMLYQQNAEEEDFFFRVKLDDMGRLCNLFWRDSMMKEDYKVYGDVMVFDTTYRTNKYNLICAPFVGINNHWKNTMFGCAFLADEKTETFEWLFTTFLKSMGGKYPITIFTDQDLAISNAISKVFPQTRHRLCLWHLHQNAISRFGKLKQEKSFKDIFNKCLTGCADESEFESCWKTMISKYELEEHVWFKRLYDLKEKWCTALNKDFFSAGILTSQRSESTNHAIGFSAKKTTSLVEFYKIFNETIKRWRSNEERDEFQSSTSHPTSVLPITGLMKQAAEVYTKTLFKDFELEFIRCISTSSNIVMVDRYMMVYDAKSAGDEKYQRVVFDIANNLINCSCKKFEECGLLCCHCLRIFHINSIEYIPQHYVMKRWTKFAKSEIWDRRLNRKNEESSHPNDFIWRHEMARKYYARVEMPRK